MSKISLVAHNIRSAHNVGALFRTADGLGIEHIYLTGYTPHPELPSEEHRLPYEVAKVVKLIHKTALGAEKTVPWSHYADIDECLRDLRSQGAQLVALEQDSSSVELQTFAKTRGSKQLALIVGNEITGLDKSILESCDTVVEIEMTGKKESFNVSIAAAIAMYVLRQS